MPFADRQKHRGLPRSLKQSWKLRIVSNSVRFHLMLQKGLDGALIPALVQREQVRVLGANICAQVRAFFTRRLATLFSSDAISSAISILCSWFVVYEPHYSTRSEPSLDNTARQSWLSMKQANTNRENLVELSQTGIERQQVSNVEFRLA